VKRLIAARKQSLALRYGDTHVVHLTNDIIGFERLYRGQAAIFFASKNPRQGSDRFPLVGLNAPAGRYRDVLSGREYTVSQNRLEIDVRDGDVALLLPDSDKVR
jgi:hypothetical protein